MHPMIFQISRNFNELFVYFAIIFLRIVYFKICETQTYKYK